MQIFLIFKDETCVYYNNSTTECSDHINIIRNIHLRFLPNCLLTLIFSIKIMCLFYVSPFHVSVTLSFVLGHLTPCLGRGNQVTNPSAAVQGEHEMQTVVGVARSVPDRDSTIRVSSL
jgi:hypothetical protein